VANTKSAEKAARQAASQRLRNVATMSRARSAIRSVLTAIAAGNKDEATKTYRATVSTIDSLVNKKLIHRNKAARHKSRLNARIKALS